MNGGAECECPNLQEVVLATISFFGENRPHVALVIWMATPIPCDFADEGQKKCSLLNALCFLWRRVDTNYCDCAWKFASPPAVPINCALDTGCAK